MKYRCSNCSKIFKIPKSLLKEILRGNIGLIFCPYCDDTNTYNIGGNK